MRMRLIVSAAVAAGLLGWSGAPAFAEGEGGGDPTKQMIQDEIKAYLKAEKEKEKEKKAKEDAEKKEKEKATMKVSWKDTVSFESGDKRFKAKLIGRIQADYWGFPGRDEAFEAAIGDTFDDGVFFRRARLGIEMTILNNTKVKAEYDFARGGANSSFADVYVALVDLKSCGAPLPDVYAGHFKEPFGLDELTSSKYSTFMERSLPTLTFAPARNTGVMLEKGFAPIGVGCEKPECFDRVLVQAGAFHAFANNFGDGVFNDDGAGDFDGDQDGWSATGRVVFVPWVDRYRPDCRIAHLGVAGSYRTDLRPDNIRFRTRPEVGLGPRTIDTGNDIVADDVVLLGAEAAIVYDRFSAQAEYMIASVSAPTQDDPVYSGWYVQASWWLTGECRTYKRGKGHFDRVKPCRPFHCEDCSRMGWGAWEIGARFSTVDLNDGVAAVQGGEQWDVTVGLNWHINNNVRVMFNYVHAEVDDRPTGAEPVDGSVDAFGIRVAAEW